MTLPVTLQWAHVPNPQTFGYDVEIADDPAFKNIEDTEVQESFPFVTIDSLTPGTKYWRVTSDQGDQRRRHGRLRRPARRHRAVGDRHVHGQHGARHAGLAGVRGLRRAAGRARRHRLLPDGAAAHGGGPGGRPRRHPDQLEPRGGAGPGDDHDGAASAGAISR